MVPEDGFSASIRSLRRDGNLSQQALGAFLGVSQRTISRWERGVDRPGAALMERLAALMVDENASRLPAIFEAVQNAPAPLALIDGTGRVLAASPSFPGAGAMTTGPGQAGLSLVLVIEDDEAVLSATRAVLKRWQFLTAGVTHGQAALDLVKSGEVVPDAAIIDFVLPGGLDGVDTALALRKVLPGLPVLIVSGEDRAETRRKVAEAGLAMITKPVDPKQVYLALVSLISD